MQVLIGITPRVHSALFLKHGDKFLTDICGILKLLKPRDLSFINMVDLQQNKVLDYTIKLNFQYIPAHGEKPTGPGTSLR